MPTITPNKIIYQLTVEDLQTVTERFWNFLGGKGAYNELLDCFEKSGIELRPEIDEYFAKFLRHK